MAINGDDGAFFTITVPQGNEFRILYKRWFIQA